MVLSLTAQVELIKQPATTLSGKGKIYALIIGISDYDNISDLNYADEDAQDFYNFLVKESSLGVDSNNVRLLINKKATSANVGKELLKLKNRMEEGSTFFIYFAGHGDANGEAQAFLLASDLPKIEDASLYAFNGGVIHVYFLKDEIRKIIAEKKANVVLVTDACRTNELAGKSEGAKTYVNKIMESNNGEIQFISCAADEKSEESSKYGQGRGIFSYYFTNGLRGLADTRPQDGKVTLRELFDYVQKNVEDATAVTDENIIAQTGKPYRQSPQYCCTEKQSQTIVLVDEKVKQQAIAKMQSAQHQIVLASNTKRAAQKSYEGVDTVLNGYYQKFYAALETNNLTAPNGQSAWDFYTAIKKRAKKTDPLVFDATEDIKAALLNDAQNTINAFYSYNDQWGMSDKTKRLFYENGVEKLRKARSLMAADDPLSPIIKLTRQCMEAAGIFASTQPADWERGVKIMDSAVAAYPNNPLPIFLRGRLLYNLERYDEALVELEKSHKIAPRWNMPLIGKSDVYYELGLYDSCENILTGIAKQQDIAYVYFKLGFLYGEAKDEAYMAVKYSKEAHKLAPQKTNIINNIGAYYARMGEEDSALYYYHKAFEQDSNNAFTLNNIATIYKNNGQIDEAIEMLNRAIAADSTTSENYETFAMIYADKMGNENYLLGERLNFYHLAVANYAKAIKYKPKALYLYTSKAEIEAQVNLKEAEKTIASALDAGFKADGNYYNLLGLTFKKGRDTTAAKKAFYAGIAVDNNAFYPRYNLAEIYYYDGLWDSALRYFKEAYEIDRVTNGLENRIERTEGHIKAREEQKQQAKRKLQLLQEYTTNPEAAIELAKIYFDEWERDSAKQIYKEVIENFPDDIDEEAYTQWLWCIKDTWTSTPEEYNYALKTIANAAERKQSIALAEGYLSSISGRDDTTILADALKMYAILAQPKAQYGNLASMAVNIATIYALTGDNKNAVEWIEIALKKGYSVWDIEDNYYYYGLSGDKKFNKLIKKYKKKQEEYTYPAVEDNSWR